MADHVGVPFERGGHLSPSLLSLLFLFPFFLTKVIRSVMGGYFLVYILLAVLTLSYGQLQCNDPFAQYATADGYSFAFQVPLECSSSQTEYIEYLTQDAAQTVETGHLWPRLERACFGEVTAFNMKCGTTVSNDQTFEHILWYSENLVAADSSFFAVKYAKDGETIGYLRTTPTRVYAPSGDHVDSSYTLYAAADINRAIAVVHVAEYDPHHSLTLRSFPSNSTITVASAALTNSPVLDSCAKETWTIRIQDNFSPILVSYVLLAALNNLAKPCALSSAPASSAPDPFSRTALILAAVALGLVLLLLAGAAVVIWRTVRRRRRQSQPGQYEPMLDNKQRNNAEE
jgi:hypothetical protein